MAVRFHGRVVDPVALWSNYVDFPENWEDDGDEFAPLVKCPNPDHETDKRHFQVNLNKDLVHCFAHCGISGTYEHAISMIEGTTHRKARKTILLHSRIGKIEPRARKKHGVKKKTPLLDNTYDTFLPQVALEFLETRGISSASIAKWELGWDRDQLRIVIPAKDARGRVSFLVRRTVKPGVEPRYLYPKGAERESMLFGACFFDPGLIRSRGLILVEGTVDTIVQHQNGFTNTGGILGSYLSEKQAKQIMNLRPPRVFTMFDADGAGLEATFSVKKRLPMIPILVCRYPKGKTDPAELSEKESQRMQERALPIAQFSARVGRRF